MTSQKLQLFDYSWSLTVFYDITINDIDRILVKLWENNCTNKGIKEVAKALVEPNSGFTHTNGTNSIMGIGWALSEAEFLDTLVHEINHLSDDICSYYHLPTYGEIPSTIAGHIAREMYRGFKEYI